MYNVYIHGIPSNPPHTLFLSVYFPRFFLKLVLTCSGMYEEKGIQSGTFPRGKREGLAALNASHYKYNICQLLAKGNFKTLDNCMIDLLLLWTSRSGARTAHSCHPRQLSSFSARKIRSTFFKINKYKYVGES